MMVLAYGFDGIITGWNLSSRDRTAMQANYLLEQLEAMVNGSSVVPKRD